MKEKQKRIPKTKLRPFDKFFKDMQKPIRYVVGKPDETKKIAEAMVTANPVEVDEHGGATACSYEDALKLGLATMRSRQYNSRSQLFHLPSLNSYAFVGYYEGFDDLPIINVINDSECILYCVGEQEEYAPVILMETID